MRLPYLNVSSMDELTVGFNFIVTLNEFTFGFQSVSGIEVEKHVEYIDEGGVNDHKVMVGAPSEARNTLTFKRGFLIRRSPILTNAARMAAARVPTNIARRAALLAASSMDPQSALEDGPALGTIQVYDRKGKKLTALYTFLSLGMTSWKADDLMADSNSVVCEEITIAHTGLVRHPVSPLPYVASEAIKSIKSEFETSNNAASEAEKQKRQNEEEDKKRKLEDLKNEKEALEKEMKRKKEELEREKNRLKELEEQLENGQFEENSEDENLEDNNLENEETQEE